MGGRRRGRDERDEAWRDETGMEAWQSQIRSMRGMSHERDET